MDHRPPHTPIDDALFSAWLRGDEAAFARAWAILRKEGRRFAAARLGGPNVCIAGVSADDVVNMALGAILSDVQAGRVVNINLPAFLRQKIRWIAADLWRAAGREVPLVNGSSDVDDLPPLEPADASPSPEQRLIDRQRAAEARRLAVARRRIETARLRATLLAWCAWPAVMSRRCAGRPALLLMLDHMEAYLLTMIAAALPARVVTGVALDQLAAIVNPQRVPISFDALNSFLVGKPDTRGKVTSRNAVDLNWSRLREIARQHGVPLPPGLGQGRVSEPRRPLARPVALARGRRVPSASAAAMDC